MCVLWGSIYVYQNGFNVIRRYKKCFALFLFVFLFDKYSWKRTNRDHHPLPLYVQTLERWGVWELMSRHSRVASIYLTHAHSHIQKDSSKQPHSTRMQERTGQRSNALRDRERTEDETIRPARSPITLQTQMAYRRDHLELFSWFESQSRPS